MGPPVFQPEPASRERLGLEELDALNRITSFGNVGAIMDLNRKRTMVRRFARVGVQLDFNID